MLLWASVWGTSLDIYGNNQYQWAQEIMMKVQQIMLQGIDRNTEEAKQMHFNQV